MEWSDTIVCGLFSHRHSVISTSLIFWLIISSCIVLVSPSPLVVGSSPLIFRSSRSQSNRSTRVRSTVSCQCRGLFLGTYLVPTILRSTTQSTRRWSFWSVFWCVRDHSFDLSLQVSRWAWRSSTPSSVHSSPSSCFSSSRCQWLRPLVPSLRTISIELSLIGKGTLVQRDTSVVLSPVLSTTFWRSVDVDETLSVDDKEI